VWPFDRSGEMPGRVDVFICAPIDTPACGDCDLQRLVEAARSAIAAKLVDRPRC
jgi:hypothetical protein